MGEKVYKLIGPTSKCGIPTIESILYTVGKFSRTYLISRILYIDGTLILFKIKRMACKYKGCFDLQCLKPKQHE